MTLFEIRKRKKMTQKEAANCLGLSLRTYAHYEKHEKEIDPLKISTAKERLSKAGPDRGIDFADSCVLITGGTGYLGQEIVKRLLQMGVNTIRILSRDERKQFDMREKFHNPRLQFFLGDITDFDSISDAFIGVDYVFHCAAMKQVPSCEFYPMEAIRVNAFGSNNVMTACMEHGVKKAVFFSSTKAVYPMNVIGLSKAIEEKNITARTRSVNSTDTVFSIVRLPNILECDGGVYSLFLSQVRQGKPITITNKKMMRYFVTCDQALNLAFYALENLEQGQILVPNVKAIRISDLARKAMREVGEKTEINEIGVRLGERMNDRLLTEEEETAKRTCSPFDAYVI